MPPLANEEYEIKNAHCVCVHVAVCKTVLAPSPFPISARTLTRGLQKMPLVCADSEWKNAVLSVNVHYVFYYLIHGDYAYRMPGALLLLLKR